MQRDLQVYGIVLPETNLATDGIRAAYLSVSVQSVWGKLTSQGPPLQDLFKELGVTLTMRTLAGGTDETTILQVFHDQQYEILSTKHERASLSRRM